MFFFSVFLFLFFFLFSTHHTKLSRFSNHTVQKVLQSANIMNWHKLVYTFHFSGWRKKNPNKQRAITSSQASHTLSPDNVQWYSSSTFSSPKFLSLWKEKGRKFESNLNQKIPTRDARRVSLTHARHAQPVTFELSFIALRSLIYW